MKKRLFSLSLFILFLSSLFSENQSSISELRIMNPEYLEKNFISLDTEWDFFWNKFVEPQDMQSVPDLKVSVPSKWNDYNLSQEAKLIAATGKGSGTYRIKLTNLKPETNYSFDAYRIAYTAFTVLANNKVIYRSGSPYTDWEQTKTQQYKDFATFKTDSNGSVLLTFYVSNTSYRKAGLLKSVNIQEERIAKANFTKELCNFGLLNGILIAIILYSLLLFFLKKDKTSLYLSLFVFSILSRLASESFPLLKVIFPQVSFYLMLKIEFMALFLCPAFYMLYINSMDKSIFKHLNLYFFTIPAFVFLPVNFILPVSILNKLIPAMQIYMFVIILVCLIFLIINAIRHKNSVSVIGILTLVIIGLGALYDILGNNFLFNNDHSVLPLCFVIYVIAQTSYLAFIQNQNQLKVIELNEYLSETNKAYYRFVPKEFLDLLSKKDITELGAGEFKSGKMSIMSADIRGFTSISEQMSEIQVFDMLNSYLKVVAPIIRKYKGIIEKYLGDGIIAIFPESSESALYCAIEMQEKMNDLRKDFEQRGLPLIKIGIGIHYGNVIIGTGGNRERMTEISISEDIDIAVKTEASTKIYKKPIIVTYKALTAAVIEAKKHKRTFDFYGKRIEESVDDKLYSIYTEKSGKIL